MSMTLSSKKKELKKKQLEVKLLEDEISRLTISDTPAPTIPDRFPIDSSVRLIGSNENYRLRQKTAIVIEHTTCFVRLRRKKEEFLRAPENIHRITDHEQEKEGH